MIVTLLTDFGTADYFVASMKGVILGRAPAVQIVDITHEIAPGDVLAAAFTLSAACPAFPPGTIHVAVVDPGVGSARRPIVVEAAGHRFVGPDNGLFSPFLERDPGAVVFHIAPEHLRQPVGTTFHGRDVFAPVAALLASGMPPRRAGERIADPVRHAPRRAVHSADGTIRGEVLHVDRFGNCVTNLLPADLPGSSLPPSTVRIRVEEAETTSLRRYYAEAGEGEIFGIWGSAGFLEISVNGGSAAERTGARRGSPVLVLPS